MSNQPKTPTLRSRHKISSLPYSCRLEILMSTTNNYPFRRKAEEFDPKLERFDHQSQWKQGILTTWNREAGANKTCIEKQYKIIKIESRRHSCETIISICKASRCRKKQSSILCKEDWANWVYPIASTQHSSSMKLAITISRPCRKTCATKPTCLNYWN